MSRDPINEIAFWKGRVRQLRDRKRYSYEFLFIRNSPLCLFDSFGLEEDGGVLCTADCKRKITGCNTRPNSILKKCCEEHETVHLGQVPAEWCTDRPVKIDLGGGVSVVKNCCPEAGTTITDEAAGKPKWPDLECPAYRKDIECMDNALKGNISEADRTLVEDRIDLFCELMTNNGCKDIPKACDKKKQ